MKNTQEQLDSRKSCAILYIIVSVPESTGALRSLGNEVILCILFVVQLP